jgi:ketosteroid isomerase-like protein
VKLFSSGRKSVTKHHLIAATTVVLISASFASAQGDSDAEQIRSARAVYNGAIARHDVPAIVSFLDDEYQITTSLGQLIQDRDDEGASWHELFASRQDLLYVRSTETLEISNDYPLAAETGTWVGSWSTTDGPVRTGGRYAAMWRKVDGVWKVRSELFVALFCDGIACP